MGGLTQEIKNVEVMWTFYIIAIWNPISAKRNGCTCTWTFNHSDHMWYFRVVYKIQEWFSKIGFRLCNVLLRELKLYENKQRPLEYSDS